MARASVTEDIESAGFGTLTERFRDKVSKLKDYKKLRSLYNIQQVF